MFILNSVYIWALEIFLCKFQCFFSLLLCKLHSFFSLFLYKLHPFFSLFLYKLCSFFLLFLFKLHTFVTLFQWKLCFLQVNILWTKFPWPVVPPTLKCSICLCGTCVWHMGKQSDSYHRCFSHVHWLHSPACQLSCFCNISMECHRRLFLWVSYSVERLSLKTDSDGCSNVISHWPWYNIELLPTLIPLFFCCHTETLNSQNVKTVGISLVKIQKHEVSCRYLICAFRSHLWLWVWCGQMKNCRLIWKCDEASFLACSSQTSWYIGTWHFVLKTRQVRTGTLLQTLGPWKVKCHMSCVPKLIFFFFYCFWLTLWFRIDLEITLKQMLDFIQSFVWGVLNFWLIFVLFFALELFMIHFFWPWYHSELLLIVTALFFSWST